MSLKKYNLHPRLRKSNQTMIMPVPVVVDGIETYAPRIIRGEQNVIKSKVPATKDQPEFEKVATRITDEEVDYLFKTYPDKGYDQLFVKVAPPAKG